MQVGTVRPGRAFFKGMADRLSYHVQQALIQICQKTHTIGAVFQIVVKGRRQVGGDIGTQAGGKHRNGGNRIGVSAQGDGAMKNLAETIGSLYQGKGGVSTGQARHIDAARPWLGPGMARDVRFDKTTKVSPWSHAVRQIVNHGRHGTGAHPAAGGIMGERRLKGRQFQDLAQVRQQADRRDTHGGAAAVGYWCDGCQKAPAMATPCKVWNKRLL